MWHAHVSDKPQAAGLSSQRACLIPSRIKREGALRRKGMHGAWKAPVHGCSVSQHHVPRSTPWTAPTLTPLSLGDAWQCPPTCMFDSLQRISTLSEHYDGYSNHSPRPTPSCPQTVINNSC